MVFTPTIEQKTHRDLVAPLLVVSLIDHKQAKELTGKDYSSSQLSNWKRREKEKSLEDQEIRLMQAKLKLAEIAPELLKGIVSTQEKSTPLAAPMHQGEALPQPVILPQVSDNAYDYISKLGITALVSEVSTLQALTIAKLSSEFRRVARLEFHIDQLLKKDNDLEAPDIKSLIGSMSSCAELRRKLALMPYGSIDPNKQLNQQAPGPQSLHFHNHGSKDYKPN